MLLPKVQLYVKWDFESDPQVEALVPIKEIKKSMLILFTFVTSDGSLVAAAEYL